MARTGTNENKAANTTDAANAADANRRTNAATDKFNADQATLKAGNNIGEDPFSKPQYLSNLNRDFATSADASASAAKANITNTALRTGDNSASYTEAIKNNARDAQRVANSGLNAQHSVDYGRNLDWQQALLQGDLAPAGITNQQYATSIGGQNAALKNLTDIGNASYGPWNAAIAAAGAAIGGACPVEGSLILMADGSEKPVERIVAGDEIMSIDGAADTVLAIHGDAQECIALKADNGSTARCSDSHSLVRQDGGYVLAKHAVGHQVLSVGKHGRQIQSLEPLGLLAVFQLQLKRAHAYCADGFWALE